MELFISCAFVRYLKEDYSIIITNILILQASIILNFLIIIILILIIVNLKLYCHLMKINILYTLTHFLKQLLGHLIYFINNLFIMFNKFFQQYFL